MTNKEAIKRIERNICNHIDWCYGMDCENCEVELAIISLVKADIYRWHDLRKNPDDLPEADGNSESEYVLVKVPVNAGCFEWNHFGLAYYSHNTKMWSTYGQNVFAWRYIEPFEEEENA